MNPGLTLPVQKNIRLRCGIQSKSSLLSCVMEKDASPLSQLLMAAGILLNSLNDRSGRSLSTLNLQSDVQMREIAEDNLIHVSGDQAPASVAPRTWFKETLNAASIYTFTPVFVAESESAAVSRSDVVLNAVLKCQLVISPEGLLPIPYLSTDTASSGSVQSRHGAYRAAHTRFWERVTQISSSLSPARPPRRHLNRITLLILNRQFSKQIMRIISSCLRVGKVSYLRRNTCQLTERIIRKPSHLRESVEEIASAFGLHFLLLFLFGVRVKSLEDSREW
ncbi:hypothetical protein F2P79_000262 [Pimephales promelas]|nr:hypothetical protein F2P79_000262 [Pimephales promelas]